MNTFGLIPMFPARPLSDPPIEGDCLQRGDRVAVVHRVEAGEVFCHVQGVDDDWVPFTAFRRVSLDTWRAEAKR